MSANDDDGGPGRRETAQRLFAAEFDDATYSYSESDEERAPNYVVAPTGARVNRLFAVGVLTEVEAVSEDVLRGRIVDPTGAFVLYAGQYQPDALAFLERTEPPAFVAVTGKARTFQPEDSDAIYTSVRPESLNEVDAETRDRWVVTTAERTAERVEAMRDAKARSERGDELESALREAGVAESLAAGVPRALDAYGTTDDYLDAVEELSRDAVRVVAGEREETGSLSVAPGEGEDAETPTASESTAESNEGGDAEPESAAAEPSETGAASGTEDAEPEGGEPDTEESQPSEPAAEPAGTTDTEASLTAESGSEPESDAEPDADGEPEAGATDELYEFDEEERQQVEEEHGLEFSTGDEVEEADELGGFESGLSEAESGEESTPSGGDEATEEPETGASEATGAETEESSEPAAPESGADFDDPEDAAVETMTDLAGGDAVEREALLDALTERYGVTAEDAEAAIEDALMSGRCYESGDGELTPI